MKLSRLALFIVPALTGYHTPLALAQSSNVTLEEVVVTATRRAESAQNVAVALTALSSQSLEDANVVDITDIGFLAPNAQNMMDLILSNIVSMET